MKKTVFLDRDGVICYDRDDYVKGVAEFVWIPGSREAITALHKSGFQVVVVTNQSAVGRKIITLPQLEEMNSFMIEGIEKMGGKIDAIYYCPHRPEDGCNCRKPNPGLFNKAAQDLDIDLNNSFLVGDSLRDIEPGLRLGCITILVLSGKITSSAQLSKYIEIQPHYIAQNLLEAVQEVILKDKYFA